VPYSLQGFRIAANFHNVKNDALRWIIGLACLAVMTYAAYLIFAPFLTAIAWALILTIMLAPVHRRLGRWIRWPTARAAVTCLLAIVLVVGPLAGLVTVLVRELIDGLQYIQAHAGDIADLDPSQWRAVAAVNGWLESWFGEPRYQDLLQTQDLGSRVVSAAQGLSQWLLNQTSAIVGNLARFSFTAVVTWLCLFYFLRDGDRGLQAATEVLPYPDDLKREMLERLNGVVVSSVYGGLIVALVQGALGALAFAVLGIPSPVLWGTVMAVLSFLPVIGGSLVWAPTAVVLAIQGRVGAAIGLALWGALAIGLVDNILRPILISGRTQMHPLLTFLAVLGGIQAFGMLGLFLGPVLVALVTGVLDVYRATVRGELGNTGSAVPASGGAVEEAESAAG
jgi:predicted PurR-regulated permease PerM